MRFIILAAPVPELFPGSVPCAPRSISRWRSSLRRESRELFLRFADPLWHSAADSAAANGIDRIELPRAKKIIAPSTIWGGITANIMAMRVPGVRRTEKYRARMQYDSPKDQPVYKHAPVHQTIQTPVDHCREMDGGQQPETDESAEQCNGNDRDCTECGPNRGKVISTRPFARKIVFPLACPQAAWIKGLLNTIRKGPRWCNTRC